MKTAEQWVSELGLLPHPEGGFYREIYRSSMEIAVEGVAGDETTRNACTHIYYLLAGDDISRFHRIRSDELWHFYAGSALDVSMIHPESGAAETMSLTADQPFGCVPAGAWFGASLPSGGFALVGCTVSPGFDFVDFEMAERQKLMDAYPAHRALIERLS